MNTCDRSTVSTVSFTVYGEPASKANSRQLVRFGTRPAVIKSAKARAYLEAFRLQCPRPGGLMEGDLRVDITIYYASRRPDLDASLIYDAMQGIIYANDRQAREQHHYWRLDPKCPRAEITVTRLDPVAATHAPRPRRSGARTP